MNFPVALISLYCTIILHNLKIPILNVLLTSKSVLLQCTVLGLSLSTFTLCSNCNKGTKKGNLTCNYIGIAPLSVAIKIFSMLVLNRLQKEIDQYLNKLTLEKTGVTKIQYLLTHVVQQCMEFKHYDVRSSTTHSC